MIDWDRVLQLCDEVGADEFDELLELFLDEVEGVAMRLSPDDSGQLERDLHFLKGSAWNLGFQQFGALCHQGELEAAQGRATQVDIAALLTSYANAKQLLLRDLAQMTGHNDLGQAGVA